jgi:hypothetical protein
VEESQAEVVPGGKVRRILIQRFPEIFFCLVEFSPEKMPDADSGRCFGTLRGKARGSGCELPCRVSSQSLFPIKQAKVMAGFAIPGFKAEIPDIGIDGRFRIVPDLAEEGEVAIGLRVFRPYPDCPSVAFFSFIVPFLAEEGVAEIIEDDRVIRPGFESLAETGLGVFRGAVFKVIEAAGVEAG